ncbi:response regulator transcription factor [Gottschalkiaceae bacterium SANA]|nr:response regulator transcription factor [Gottschalkiaceae bacterium SANA]
MNGLRVLIAEDEQRLRKIVRTYLQRDGYEVLEATNGQEAIDLLDENEVDLVILDVMMPHVDGWSVLRQLRSESDLPVIMLTARGDEEDKLFGFELGAEDYMTKPFSPRELMARVRVVMKRHEKRGADSNVQMGKITLFPQSHQVQVDESEIVLSPKEYDLLFYFVNNAHRVLTREMILDRVWGYDYFGDDRTVDTHVKRLRKKLDIAGKQIVTVRGAGYRFEEDV